MDRDEIEFLISRSLDEDLSDQERARLDAATAADPAVRKLLEDYRTLDATLKSPVALPGINWKTLAEHISAGIDEEGQQQRLRIFPFHSYQIAAGAGLALAASALIVLGIWMRTERPRGHIEVVLQHPQQINVAAADVQVTIGPSPQLAESANLPAYEALVELPTRVAIDSGLLGAQDIDRSLFR